MEYPQPTRMPNDIEQLAMLPLAANEINGLH
jgi:hypothetical protein